MSTVSVRRRWWQVVDWRTVAVAGLPMWVLVVGVVAWQRFTPKPVVMVPVPTEPAPPPKPVEVVKTPEVLPPPRPAEDSVKKLDPEVVKALADGGKAVWQAVFAGKGEDDRPLVELPPPAILVNQKQPIPEGCKTHETALHFVKNLAEAQKRAKKDDKLVFVLHLSGNIDDPGFT